MVTADEQWMQQALALAEKAASLGEVPVGAIVVQNEKIIGEGFNQPITTNDATAHAEVLAIRDACARVENYRLVDATLYVTIEPCTMCFGSIVHARIKRLVFGAPEPKAGVLCSHTHLLDSDIYNHQFECEGGVLGDESTALIQRFFQKRRAEKKAPKEP